MDEMLFIEIIYGQPFFHPSRADDDTWYSYVNAISNTLIELISAMATTIDSV